MGLEAPLPGSATFQATDSAVHLVGNWPAVMLPLPVGPRHAGHSPMAQALSRRSQ